MVDGQAMYNQLAEHYDRIYASKNYEPEADRLREVIAERDPNARSLLDVACGTGGHLLHLQKHFECEGLDLSEEMVRIAREKLTNMPLHVASMTDFDLGRRFDAVVCLFSAVGHLVTVERLSAAIGNMAAHLNPGGVLVVEPWIDPADWIAGHVNMDTYEDDDLKIARLSVSEPVDRGRIVMEWLVGTKFGVQRLRDEHEMGWFTRDEYESAFRQAGLSVTRNAHGLTGRGLYIGTTHG